MGFKCGDAAGLHARLQKKKQKQAMVDPRRHVFLIALAVSAMLFVLHKTHGRFADAQGKSCQKEHAHSWMCKWPGAILSHKPWTRSTGVAVLLLYVAIAGAVMAGLHAATLAATPQGRQWGATVVVLFTLGWAGWACFETHHTHKTHERKHKPIKRGTVFAQLFTLFTLFVYLPITLFQLYPVMGGWVFGIPLAIPCVTALIEIGFSRKQHSHNGNHACRGHKQDAEEHAEVQHTP